MKFPWNWTFCLTTGIFDREVNTPKRMSRSWVHSNIFCKWKSIIGNFCWPGADGSATKTLCFQFDLDTGRLQVAIVVVICKRAIITWLLPFSQPKSWNDMQVTRYNFHASSGLKFHCQSLIYFIFSCKFYHYSLIFTFHTQINLHFFI